MRMRDIGGIAALKVYLVEISYENKNLYTIKRGNV
jgi:hypothetical protein